MLRYAALRLVLFLVVGGVLYLLGMRNVLLVATAIIVSALAAYVFLPRQRDAAAKTLEVIASGNTSRRGSHRPDVDAEHEDSLVDAYLDEQAAALDQQEAAQGSEEDPEEDDEPKPELN